MHVRTAFSMLLLAQLTGCAPEPPAGAPDSAAVRAGVHSPEHAAAGRAVEALAPFKAGLQAALQAGLADSPTAAVEACRSEAPRIAARASSVDVRMGRTSHRVRNPDNAPAPWMRAVLDDYLRDPAARAPRTVALGDGGYGYAEPIVMQPQCTLCHGPSVAPPVATVITELYPDDQATGFQPGDLRGLFWVTLDAPARADL